MIIRTIESTVGVSDRSTGRGDILKAFAQGPLGAFLAGRRLRFVDAQDAFSPPETCNGRNDVLLSYRRLQDLSDYRQAIRTWFEQTRSGDHLILVVPHAFLYERRLGLPSPWRTRQRRLYTPASLLAEVEEALSPNHYRVRWAGDLDRAYDYGLGIDVEPRGESDAAVVLERIVPPDWSLDGIAVSVPMSGHELRHFAFEPPRTRVEVDVRPPTQRLLVLKLDHLGDLIMAVPALRRMRQHFPQAWIDLMVGSWNIDMARDLGVANRVIAFDAFPQNSSEEEALVVATLGQFRSLVTEEYDLAIDLRTDIDTRVLLEAVRAEVKAGIGTRARFPFLDIALPLDSTRNEAERVLDVRIGPDAFDLQGSARRGHFGLHSRKQTVERGCAIVWGPYIELDVGDYIFDFYIDLAETRSDGLLRLDVALDRGKVVSEMIISSPGTFQLAFRVERPRTIFEARIAAVDGHPSIDFGFYGGRLIKRGPGNVLHQTEYTMLLIELVKLRVQELGLARDIATR